MTGYVSRAAFKLEEIQKRHKVIKKGASVLDLGCAPGAWLQIACQQIGPRRHGGLILGIDIQNMERPEKFIDDRVHILKADVMQLHSTDLIHYAPKVGKSKLYPFFAINGGGVQGFDVVLSDMLHSTSGNAVLDVGISLELTAMALHLAVGHDLTQDQEKKEERDRSGVLKAHGNLVMKLYEGSGTNAFVKEVKKYFEKISRVRPEASRKTSREFFLVAKNYITQS